MSYARINMHVLYSFGLICIHLYSGFFPLYFVFYYVTLLYLKCSIVLWVGIKDDDDDEPDIDRTNTFESVNPVLYIILIVFNTKKLVISCNFS